MSNQLVYNLLYIVSCLERGGLELRLLEFAKQFPDNYKVHICVTSDQHDLLERFQSTNAGIIVVPIKRAYSEFSNICNIHEYIIKNNIKIINSFDFKGLMIGCLLKLQTHSRIKLVHNTVDLLHSYTCRQKIILKFLFYCVDKSICNSEQAKAILISIGIKKSLINVINNGVDTIKFRPDPDKRLIMLARYGIAKDETVIGSVANFRWEKNYPFLVDSFCALSEKYDNLKLLCVGGGPQLEQIKKLVTRKGIIDKVIFTGSVDNVPDFLQMMDLFVLCSIKESFPNCMIQAMSSGLPVVTSDIGACKDIITDGVNGLKFTVNDVAQFLEHVEMLIHDKVKSRSIAEEGKNTILERYSQTSMIDNYLELYHGLLFVTPGIRGAK